MARSQSGEVRQKTVAHRLLWVVLVVLVPLLVTIGMVGAALQFVGVPVWQDTVKLISHKVHSQPVVNSTPNSAAQVVSLKTQLATLNTKNQSLATQLQTDEAKVSQLQQQNKKLETQLTASTKIRTQALQQASILKGMDPSAAALVLAKLTTKDAATVVAVMSPSDSGPILAQMSPSEAGKLLTMAAQVQFPASTANSAAVNSTGSTGTLNTTGG